MRKGWLMCVFLGTLAWGQGATTAPQPPQPAKEAPDTSASVSPQAAVITVKGVCAATPKPVSSEARAAKPGTAAKAPAVECKTVITKAEFEKLASGISPNMTPQFKKQLAGMLPQLIALSNEAKKKGLDKTSQYEETVKFAKMQILTNQLRRKVQDDAGAIPPEEIEKYYKEHGDAFEQYNLDRVFVPRTKQGEGEAKQEEEKDEKPSEEAQKAKQAEEKTKADEKEQSMTKVAEDLRARAAAGEDFAKLQKEAFDAAGMKLESPTVNLPSVRRTGLSPAQAVVFDLKPGEVSPVINDSGGHFIYKMNSKTPIPLDQAKTEIHGKLQSDRMREMTENLNKSFQVETNDAYFGPGGVGAAPPQRPPYPRPGGMTAPPAQQPTAPPAQPPAPKPN